MKSDRIVTISQKVPFLGSGPTVVTAEEFESWQKSGLFASSALIDTAEYTLEGKGRPERIYGASVTPEFFKGAKVIEFRRIFALHTQVLRIQSMLE